jgi:dipeptidyl aminopeptidase/acylaminoacyl peptidase
LHCPYRRGVLALVKSEHLPLLNSVSVPAAHPDGTRAVVSVVRPDFDADAYVGQLWNVPLDPSKRPRRLTRGFRHAAPDFSPDGLVLAFLRAAAGGKASTPHASRWTVKGCFSSPRTWAQQAGTSSRRTPGCT